MIIEICTEYNFFLDCMNNIIVPTEEELFYWKLKDDNKFDIFKIVEYYQNIQKDYPSVIYDFTKSYEKIVFIDDCWGDAIVKETKITKEQLPKKIVYDEKEFRIVLLENSQVSIFLSEKEKIKNMIFESIEDVGKIILMK